MPLTVREPDIAELQLSVALFLYDGFTGSSQLLGDISASIAPDMLASPPQQLFGSPPASGSARQWMLRKTPEAIFLFFGLPPGAYVMEVQSNEGRPDQTPPYYLPITVSLEVSELPESIAQGKPVWPAFPDITLADSSKPLDDPTQPEAYRVQRQAATLRPTTAYPFPAGTTLVRGTVFADGVPLSGANVQKVGDTQAYTTATDGGFVLFLTQVSGVGETITLQATHALHPTVQIKTDVHRGMTVATNIVMAP
jgi:hypothetical protein